MQGVRSLLNVPIGTRVRIGPQYPLLVVQGDQMGGPLGETTKT